MTGAGRWAHDDAIIGGTVRLVRGGINYQPGWDSGCSERSPFEGSNLEGLVKFKPNRSQGDRR